MDDTAGKDKVLTKITKKHSFVETAWKVTLFNTFGLGKFERFNF